MIKSHDFASTYVGTPYYMSPEICAAERYTVKSDIWALGCIMYELCAREPPFNAKSHYELVSKIKTGRYPSLPECYSDELAATIRECIRVNPDERPTTFDLIQLPIMRLMRKEKEVAELHSVVKARERTVATLESALADEKAAFEGIKQHIRQEIDDSLRREWEVKAQLEITAHINAELENLRRQFDVELQTRLAEMRHRGLPNEAARPDFRTSAVKTAAGNQYTEPPLTTDTHEMSAESPDAPKRTQRTPMRRVQTMFVGNGATPGDVEMSEPSPMVFSALSLSPRRNPGAKVPGSTSGNIFRTDDKQQAGNTTDLDAVWKLPRGPLTRPDSDDEDDDDDDIIPPSPTRSIKSNKNPFMARNRPDLAASKLTTSKLTNKPLPAAPGGDAKSRARTPSPTRRLSKIPSAANLVRNNTEPGPTLSRKPSTKKEEPHLGKVAAKNNIRGRTLVELQQARAGGRPLSVIGPGAENTSPKRAHGSRGSSESLPAVWDPQSEEMPSPFLVRSKSQAARTPA